MSDKNYRLTVKKIPLPTEIVYKKPNFPYFKELHLDLLENKNKLKKNPPKPIFVKTYPTPPPEVENFDIEPTEVQDSDDFTLEELERSYKDNLDDDEDNEDDEDDDTRSNQEQSKPEQTKQEQTKQEQPKSNGEYQQQYFDKQEEEQESEEDKEKREKADLLFKFMVLRRQYPKVEIPEFTEHSDFNTMKRVYEQTIRRVSLDSNVDSYKQYIVGGFMVMEWVSTNWLGINLGGFTQQQVKMMNKYDRLLIELGEKNHQSSGSRFPVEIRLLFLIVFNAGLFYVQKMIFSGGSGDGNILNSLFDNMNQSDNTTKKKPTTRGGMKGPTITPQDVEDITKSQSPEEEEVD